MEIEHVSDVGEVLGLTMPIPAGWSLVGGSRSSKDGDVSVALQFVPTKLLEIERPGPAEFMAIKRVVGATANEALSKFIAEFLN